MSLQSDVEDANAYMQWTHPDGLSLYQHMSNILFHALHTPSAPSDLIELSVQLKHTYLQRANPKEVPAVTHTPASKQALLNALNTVATQLKHAQAPVQPEDNAGASSTSADGSGLRIADVLAENQLLQSVGVDLRTEEAYQLLLTLPSVCQQHGLPNVRLWGRIFGTHADYIVLESHVGPVAPPHPPKVKSKKEIAALDRTEIKGRGANEFVYLVANHVHGPWTRLPNVKPDMIVLSRSMRRFFTGKLDAVVNGLPRFPYPESHYLRAQIARISASTHVAPKGQWATEEVEEVGEKLVEDEAWEGAEGASELENWVHTKRRLLKTGRAEAWVAPELEVEEGDEEAEGDGAGGDAADDDAGADADAAGAGEEEEEEVLPLLGSLDADAPSKGYPAAVPLYTVRTSHAGIAGAATHPHTVTAVLSNLWPGAIAASKKKSTACAYVGWAQKWLPAVYTPPHPAPLRAEWAPVFEEGEEEDDAKKCIEQTDPVPPSENDAAADGDEEQGDEQGDEEEEDD